MLVKRDNRKKGVSSGTVQKVQLLASRSSTEKTAPETALEK